MKATITKITRQPSNQGGGFYYVFFKGDYESYKTCVYPGYRNFKLWREVVDHPQAVGMVLDNLKILDEKHHLIDADSVFGVVSVPPEPEKPLTPEEMAAEATKT